jgi:hypothetical protein
VNDLPGFIVAMGQSDSPKNRIAKEVWAAKEEFVRWPKRELLFWPGLKRHPNGQRKDCYSYSPQQRAMLEKAGIREDARNNGPAILAFQLAEGERPSRTDVPKFHWSVHHIYDGRFPASQGSFVRHAMREGEHFTQSAGLVAVHPIADGLAGDCAYFAWLLRYEAFLRFGYDPDKVF